MQYNLTESPEVVSQAHAYAHGPRLSRSLARLVQLVEFNAYLDLVIQIYFYQGNLNMEKNESIYIFTELHGHLYPTNFAFREKNCKCQAL